jgi:DNA-binding response OmpR family regulator
MISEGNNMKNNEQHILMIAGEDFIGKELYLDLSEKGYTLSIADTDEIIAEKIDELTFNMVVASGDSHSRIAELVRKIKQKKSLPTIALVKKEMIANVNGYLDMVDDFIISPYNKRELMIRINRLLHKTPGTESGEQIKCNGLTIDLVTCEVVVNGVKIELTFKEYELLKLLASNRGRVFTRESLLDKIWGYDYFGGDRTVDVHVRRLRSKIEDASHIYIETVRNIGYRFIKNEWSG